MKVHSRHYGLLAAAALSISAFCAEAKAIQYTLNNVTATYTAPRTGNPSTRTITVGFSGSFNFTGSSISNVAITATGESPSTINFTAGSTSGNQLTFTGVSPNQLIFTLSSPLVEAPNTSLSLLTPGSIGNVCVSFAGNGTCFQNTLGTATFNPNSVTGTITTPVPALPPAAISLIALAPLLALRKRYCSATA
ncbi:hypothetical protein [Synechococcus sp. 1G10]|uniref:hypothetical protein n=1 Tax=Synechococcus sp. 1G10 TaxID=2025605 RepID=UPI00117C5C8D|nr:hypothetical protein [Synechococcus sp. 1G10]